MKKILLVISLMKSLQEQSNNRAAKILQVHNWEYCAIGVYDELRLSDNFVTLGEIMLEMQLYGKIFLGQIFVLFPMIEITPKHYNFKRRLEKNKNIQNNS